MVFGLQFVHVRNVFYAHNIVSLWIKLDTWEAAAAINVQHQSGKIFNLYSHIILHSHLCPISFGFGQSVLRPKPQSLQPQLPIVWKQHTHSCIYDVLHFLKVPQ